MKALPTLLFLQDLGLDDRDLKCVIAIKKSNVRCKLTGTRMHPLASCQTGQLFLLGRSEKQGDVRRVCARMVRAVRPCGVRKVLITAPTGRVTTITA